MSSRRDRPRRVSDTVRVVQESINSSGIHTNNTPFGLEWSENFRPTENYDVILIHGIRDVIGEVWNRGGENWVEFDLLSKITWNVASFHYDNYSYDATIYSVNGIEKEATRLLEALTKKHGNPEDFPRGPSINRDLIFITRDVGGLIAKKALCIASRSPKTYDDIVRRTTMMIFYNCPHRSFDREDTEDNILQLLGSPGSAWTRSVAQKAKRLANEIERIHQDCSHALLWQQILVQNIITLSGEVKEKNTEQSTWNYECRTTNQCLLEQCHTTEVEHHQLGLGRERQPNPKSHVIFAIRKFILYITWYRQCLKRDSLPGKILNWSTLLPESPPVRWPSVMKPHEVPFQQWSKEHERFDEWLQAYHQGLRVVHLYKSSKIPELSDQVLQHVQARQNLVDENMRAKALHFRFHPHDSRLNTTRAMLLYFLTQQMRWADQDCIWPIGALPHAFSLRDLYQCFVDLVWTPNEHKEDAFRNENMNAWLIISGIEHADEDFAWFIQQVSQLGNLLETPLKVFATSNGDERVMNKMATFTNFDLSSCPVIERVRHESLMRTTLTSRRDWEEISQSWPGLELTVPRTLDVHDSDPQLADMVLQLAKTYIRHGNFPLGWDKKLEEILRLSPSDLFQKALDSLSEEQRMLANEVAKMVKTSLRPLTVEEIASALLPRLFNFDSSTKRVQEQTRLVMRIHHIIPVLFTIQHGEVHFAHDSIMQSEHPDIFDLASSRHASMTSICLGFLRSTAAWDLVKSLVEERIADDIQISESRKDFLAYAANHMFEHYNLSERKVPIDDLLSFLRVPQARESWLDALNVLSGSRARKPCPNDLSLLQCAAQTGIVDLVAAIMADERQSQDFQAQCVGAITQAAFYGHIEVVRLILRELKDVAPELKESISAAASHGDKSCLDLLMDFCSKSEDFDWPKAVLCRAAWLGFDDVVEKLLQIGLTQGWKFEAELSRSLREFTKLEVGSFDSEEQLLLAPLAIALRFGYGQVVRVLLDARKTEFSPDISKMLLEQAVCWGDPEILQVLIEHSARKLDSAVEDRLLLVAAKRSSFRAIEALIKAGHDMSWHSESLIQNYALEPLITTIPRRFSKCAEYLLRSDVELNPPRSDYLETALGVAVRRSDLQIARMIIAAGGDANVVSDVSHPLSRAVEIGYKEMVELLLDNGADIEAQVDVGWGPQLPPLGEAAIREDHEILDILLQRGGQVNYDAIPHLQPLFKAAEKGRFANVKILLEHGAEVEGRYTNKYHRFRPLNEAYPYAAIVNILLDYKADIDFNPEGKGTVLFRASEGGYLETVQALLSRHVKPDLELEFQSVGSRYDSLTPLCMACKYGHTEIMRALLEAGANARHKACLLGNLTPLHLCFEFIAQKGADPDRHLLTLLLYGSRVGLDDVDTSGRTALHLINKTTPVSFVKALVNAGASIDVLDDRGHTPLAKAVISGNIEVYEYLAARPRNGPQNDVSPLRLACSVANATMVEHLIETGADVNDIDKVTGETPLYALFTGAGASSDLVRFLVQDCGADVKKPGGEFKYPIIRAFTCQIDDCKDHTERDARALKMYSNIRLLIRHGADIDAADDAGRRAVHIALSYQSPIVPWHLFIQFNADLSARDGLGRSALHYAAALGLPNDLKHVASFKGVDVNDVDDDGWTPLMWAARQRQPQEFTTIATLLIDRHGADIWATANTGDTVWTPLKLARFQGCYSDAELHRLEPSQETRKSRHRDKYKDTGLAESAPTNKGIESWDDEIHRSDIGFVWTDIICDGCFTECRGVRWRCTHIPTSPWEYHHRGEYNLCYICYPHRQILHPYHEHFEECGFMYLDDTRDMSDTESIDVSSSSDEEIGKNSEDESP